MQEMHAADEEKRRGASNEPGALCISSLPCPSCRVCRMQHLVKSLCDMSLC